MALDEGTIVQTAQEAGSFNTLLAALEAANLTSALEGTGPFTVFPPTDDAFAQIDSDVLNDLIANPELLARVLTYHVVSGEFTSTDVAGLDFATNLNGKDVSLSFDGTTAMVDGTTVMVDDATVIAPISRDNDGNPRIDDAIILGTNIGARNGMVHIIDRVIFPS